MKNPLHYLIRMILFLLIIFMAVGFLSSTIWNFFQASPSLNGLILGILVLGAIHIFRQTYRLMQETNWLQKYRSEGNSSIHKQNTPHLLAPIASVLGEKGAETSLSASTQRSLLDGLNARLEESRDLSRYLIGLLIFLGLLGTFWGLLETIDSVGSVIAGLSVGDGNFNNVFSDLKKGLQAPLAGMSIAFSSSLFGLAGSLILGFLELQFGQAQNNFYNNIENWLACQTRRSVGSINVRNEDASIPAYVEALLGQTADSLEKLQRTLGHTESTRISADQNLIKLTEVIGVFTEEIRAERSELTNISNTHIELKPLIQKINENTVSQTRKFNDMLTGVKNIDMHLSRLSKELAQGRSETISELRDEIRVLSRTIAAAAERSGSQ
ncbi:MAG: flagellar motor protein MotA [Rhodospirillaceae bacterium]|nr:flagellar motor protein MotA [Rhodospirillaceae bacterium]